MSIGNPIERMLAWRYLRARRREGFIAITTWFAMIGIMIGVATLILVTSLMNGVREEMTSRFIGIDGHVVVFGARGAMTDYDTLAAGIKTVPGVASATPKVTGQVMATNRGVALGAQVMAIPYEALAKRPLFTEHVSGGNLEGLNDGSAIVLGQRLAENLHVQVGDQLTLISPQGQATIAGFIPRMKAYTVGGTLKLGMHEFDSSLILMPFAEAQNYFMLNAPAPCSPPPVELQQSELPTAGCTVAAASNIEVMVDDVNAAPAVASAIRAQGGPDLRVYDWQQTNASVFAALTVQRNVMVIILALIILVAAFNIISSLVMLVKDKGRDIAVLRTMGMTRAGVMRVFLMAGGMIGFAGTVAGLGLGLLLAAYLEPLHHALEKALGQEILVENIYFLSTLPTKTDPREVVIIVILALVLSFLSALYPARRAAKLDPAEALRYE